MCTHWTRWGAWSANQFNIKFYMSTVTTTGTDSLFLCGVVTVCVQYCVCVWMLNKARNCCHFLFLVNAGIILHSHNYSLVSLWQDQWEEERTCAQGGHLCNLLLPHWGELQWRKVPHKIQPVVALAWTPLWGRRILNKTLIHSFSIFRVLVRSHLST